MSIRLPNTTAARLLGLSLTAVLALGMAACTKTDQEKVGEHASEAAGQAGMAASEAATSMGDAAREAASDAAAATSDAAADARAAASDLSQDVKEGAQDAAQAASNAATAVGEAVADAAITAAVNAEFAKDAAVSALQINVDTNNGAVTLKGTVKDDAAKARAEDIAKAVKGVKSVQNELTISAS